MAHRELGRAGGGTVNTTELVHDLYVRLSQGDELACLTRIDDENLTAAGRRMGRLQAER